jgi:mono/diheme cytochrome c family protein
VADLPAKARTILKEHCFQCHGEDPENMEGDGLAILDHKMLVERKIIVARQPGKSPLIKKVELGTMPPPGEGARVPPGEIKVLRAWIEAGALAFPGESGRH